MLLLVLIISRLCCMLNKSAAEQRCVFLSVGLIRLTVMWKVFLSCLSVCYMSRTLFQIKPRPLLLALSTSQSWYRQHNPSTKQPSWKEQLIKSVVSWNVTRGTGRYILCLFSYNVIHQKDTWTLTVVFSYSSVQTRAVLHSYTAHLYVFHHFQSKAVWSLAE